MLMNTGIPGLVQSVPCVLAGTPILADDAAQVGEGICMGELIPTVQSSQGMGMGCQQSSLLFSFG